MTNILTKNSKYVLIQPPTYQIYVPGYSYFIGVEDAEVNSSGITYIVNYLNARGFNINASLIHVLSLSANGTSWIVSIFPVPLRTLGGFIWIDPGNIVINASDVNTTENGSWVNIPSKFTTITPDAYFTKYPIIGWNGGAVSKSSINTGVATFSINPKSVGVVVGLSPSISAVLSAGYSDIQYAIYSNLNQYIIYTNGSAKTDFKIFNNSDVFSIIISEGSVIFLVNNIEVYNEIKVKNSIQYSLDASLYYSDDSVFNATIESRIPSLIKNKFTYYNNLLSVNNSRMYSKIKYVCNINAYYGIVNTIKYSNKLISLGYSLLNNKCTYINKVNPYYGITNRYSVNTFLHYKGYSKITNKIGFSNSITAGLLKPTIPAILYTKYFVSNYIRRAYMVTPQVFINT